jgi:8-oxo-dGTP diphosphatase
MNYGISPRALIRDDIERILFLRRSPECTYWPGEWEIPGGKPDPGEDVFECVKRETSEEAGLQIDLIRLIGASETDLPSVRVVYLIFEARIIGGEVRLSEEHVDGRWVAPAEIGTLPIMQPIAQVLRGVRLL